MKIDQHSPTWLSVKAHAMARLTELRSRLEGNLGWDETLQVRAQIREIRGVLSLAVEEQPLIEVDFELPS